MNNVLRAFLTLVCIVTLTLAHDAEARSGGGRSMGSRGTRTYNTAPTPPAYQARPIERSVATPQPTARPQPAPTTAPMAAPGMAPAAAPSFIQQHPFLSSMAGGFLGAGLYNALFGHSSAPTAATTEGATTDSATLPASENTSLGNSLGSMLQFLLIGGGLFLMYRLFRRRAMPAAAAATPFGQNFMAQEDIPFTNMPAIPAATATPAPSTTHGTALAISDADYQAFRELLEKIQFGWNLGDIGRLRQHLSPEMVQYFSEELTANASQGVANKVEHVNMLEGDLIEAWSEATMDYATVRLKWSALDYKARLDRQPNDPDYVVEGSATQPVEAEEVWTLTRARRGGHWLLSAIQQIER